MSGIGRNIPCPCMSGKKYKKCCEVTGLWAFFQEQGYNYVNELFVVEELLRVDTKFQSFYSLERPKIQKDVFFIQKDNLGSQASYGNIENVAYLIITKPGKAFVKDSIHIAHEIEHLVLCSQGHKVAQFVNDSQNQISRKNKLINDMIYDPLVNKVLINHHFDLVSYLQFSDNIQMSTIDFDSEKELMAMTLYVKRFFDYKNLQPNINAKEIPFNKWVEKKYPNVVQSAEDIIQIILNNGVDTPSETEKTINEIIKFLDLNNELTLVSV